MSNWKLLEQHRVTKPTPHVHPVYISDSRYGFNGLFRIPNDGEIIRCIASDGIDSPGPEWKWQHVSVSIEGETRPPKWGIMCWIKDLFWEDEDWVVQFHPAKSEYVNIHPGCLHLWRPLVEKLPTPLAIMVGPKKLHVTR
jgi:hypothetical protein